MRASGVKRDFDEIRRLPYGRKNGFASLTGMI